MIVQIGDWKFHVFEVTNRKYYAKQVQDRCDCAWCRNFYHSVDQTYPNLRSFLERFSVRIDAPDEMISFSPTLCSNFYSICGSILERGEESIEIDGLLIEPQTASQAMVHTQWGEEPIFFLYVDCMTLPWVLNEPIDQADSPAKSKDPISRLLGRWITE